MSRLGDFFSNTFAQAKSHEPGWIQRLPSMPGSAQSLQDAFIANRWSHPYGSEQNSMDIFAGGVGHPAGSEHPWARTIGRAVGSYFLGNYLNNLTGTSWAGPAARGAGRLFSGGTSGADGADGTGGLGEVLSAGGATPQDNSMIAPLHMPDLFADSGPSMSPDLLAFMLTSRRGGDSEQQDNQSHLGGGGFA
jgi:hypothetical protein